MKGAVEMDVVAFGEILWDVIDGVPHLGGAPFNFAAHAARLGLKTAIETRGADGCRVASRGESAFDSPAICDGPVVDTVGAGDSFSAAFIAAVLRGESLKAAAEAGNRLAGKVAARAGAIPEDI